LYRLWFEYLKRAVDSGHAINTEYYKAWLPIEGLTFNQWWTGFKKRLTYPSVTRVSNGQDLPEDALIMAVPFSVNKAVALKQIKLILDAELDGKARHAFTDYAPTAGSNIKYAAFRLMLHCYDSELKTDGKGRKASRVARVKRVIERYEAIEQRYGGTKRRIDKMPKALDVSKVDGLGAEDLLRNYYRSVQKAKRIITNVAQGQFPGKYT
jgi:hypothetical protein